MRNNPRRVMLLGGPNTGMPQQLLDGADIVTLFQQAAGERVAESMRGSVHVGNCAHALNGAPQVAFEADAPICPQVDQSLVEESAGEVRG